MRATSMLPGVFVHPQGLCEATEVGAGTRVWAFAHVLEGARVGTDCNVCDGAYVEGGAVLGDRVTVKNQVMVFAGVTVADDVFLGPGVTFTNAFVGAGTVVTRDVAPHAFVVGNPGRQIGWACRCGRRLDADLRCSCGRAYAQDTAGLHERSELSCT
jgi:UDP-2-acetamido-3-amino-2,3-dideoxy-glucuronate N-acetyltransferase